MKSAIRFRKDSQNEFIKLFSGLCRSKSSWEVWADFIAMSAITISTAFDQEGPTHDARIKEYMRTIQRYSKADQQVFPKLFAVTVNALDDEPDQDFFGELFMGLDLGNHWKGQFFTPYSISRMLAEIQIEGLEAHIEKKGWVGIHDPCCGAGSLLIAARNVMVRKEMSPTTALYVAQDIDRTAALMCYIQLSLLGCAGYVVVADSLCNPLAGHGSSPLLIDPKAGQEVWLMPALYDETWCMRIQWERIKLALELMGAMGGTQKRQVQDLEQAPQNNEQPQINFAVNPVSRPLNEGPGGQLTLF